MTFSQYFLLFLKQMPRLQRKMEWDKSALAVAYLHHAAFRMHLSFRLTGFPEQGKVCDKGGGVRGALTKPKSNTRSSTYIVNSSWAFWFKNLITRPVGGQREI